MSICVVSINIVVEYRVENALPVYRGIVLVKVLKLLVPFSARLRRAILNVKLKFS